MANERCNRLQDSLGMALFGLMCLAIGVETCRSSTVRHTLVGECLAMVAMAMGYFSLLGAVKTSRVCVFNRSDVAELPVELSGAASNASSNRVSAHRY